MNKTLDTFIKSISTRIVSEAELVDEAISIAVKTKISGVDNVFSSPQSLSSILQYLCKIFRL